MDEASAGETVAAARSVVGALAKGSGITADLARHVGVSAVGRVVVLRLTAEPAVFQLAAGQPGSGPR